MKIAVVDYGMGNLRSVSKALEHVAPGTDVRVTSDPQAVQGADRVVFPGQGAMPDCMRELDARGLRPAVLAAWRVSRSCREWCAASHRRKCTTNAGIG